MAGTSGFEGQDTVEKRLVLNKIQDLGGSSVAAV